MSFPIAPQPSAAPASSATGSSGTVGNATPAVLSGLPASPGERSALMGRGLQAIAAQVDATGRNCRTGPGTAAITPADQAALNLRCIRTTEANGASVRWGWSSR